MNMLTAQRKPWYREPWPWILMSGPLVVVVAGLTTAWIAYTHADPLVGEDYYRKGLAAAQTLSSSARAQALGLSADVHLSADDTVVLTLSSTHRDFRLPPTLSLTLSHPTRAGLDQTQTLHLQDGRYRGRLHLPLSGHWLLLVETTGTESQSWRMLGKVVLPAAEVRIGGTDP